MPINRSKVRFFLILSKRAHPKKVIFDDFFSFKAIFGPNKPFWGGCPTPIRGAKLRYTVVRK